MLASSVAITTPGHHCVCEFRLEAWHILFSSLFVPLTDDILQVQLRARKVMGNFPIFVSLNDSDVTNSGHWRLFRRYILVELGVKHGCHNIYD